MLLIFDEVKDHRVVAGAHARNVKGRRVLEKLARFVSAFTCVDEIAEGTGVLHPRTDVVLCFIAYLVDCRLFFAKF